VNLEFENDYETGLEPDDVLSLQALGALLDFELDSLPFIQALVTLGLDRREVHEDVLTGRALDETITLCRVKPLDSTLLFGHLEILLMY
jgi:hypothetical protein